MPELRITVPLAFEPVVGDNPLSQGTRLEGHPGYRSLPFPCFSRYYPFIDQSEKDE